MRRYIPSLNGLRAISIFFVLYAHVLLNNFHLAENPGGQIGVTIFFVISGYLITLLLLEEEKASDTISLKSFYVRRALRIFPAYYFLLLVYFILELTGILQFTANSWVTSLTYTKYFPVKNGIEWESGHFWSLSIEEHFYLIWPIVFKTFRKFRAYFAFLVILTIPVIRMTTTLPSMHIFMRADSIMWGCVFALYNDNIARFITKRHKLFSAAPFAILLFSLVFKRVISILGYHKLDHLALTFFGSFGSITDISIGFIILISIYRRNNLWYKTLNTAPFNFVGKLSYSIYLWQQIFFSPYVGKLSEFPFNIVYIFMAAFLSYNLIEKPFLRIKSKLEGRKDEKNKQEPPGVIMRPSVYGSSPA